MPSASDSGAVPATASLPARVFRFLTLRRSPDVLPGQRWLAALAAALSLGLGVLATAGLDETPARVAIGMAISAVFLFVVPWLLTRWTRRRDRYPRALFALGLCDACMLLLLWPVLALGPDDFSTPGWPLYASAIWSASAVVWMIAIRTRIWMYVTARSVVVSLLLTCLLLAVETAAHHFLS